MENKAVEQIEELVDAMMVNTICNPLLPTDEHVEGYMQCRRDVLRVIERVKDECKELSGTGNKN